MHFSWLQLCVRWRMHARMHAWMHACMHAHATPALVYARLHVQIQSIDDIVNGPAAIKLLYMSSEAKIKDVALPHIDSALQGTSADWTQAVDTMLEVVPKGALSAPANFA